MKIGFIGTGVMGSAMVKNLLKADFTVTVFNRTKEHAQAVLDAGATWADSPAEVTSQSDVVITMVGFPNDVKSVYFGNNGIFKQVHAGQVLIDMTTSSPKIAQQIFAEGQKQGVEVLDAPVSGGDVGAQNATLTIMVGGLEATYQKMQSLFSVLGKSITYFGTAGAGQNAKMANQIMIAGTMTGMSEMLVYAKAAGLDLQQVIQTVDNGGGQNWSLANYGPRVLKGDYQPGFYAKHFLKDLKIALDVAAEMKLNLPATELAKQLYDRMVNDAGLGDESTDGLVNIYHSWRED
ncbi:NAD(P)-dependent oxidoreductase [Lentilactobacillus senioris]|uniref:NAD(P)-dependent oxidoreductase n=1 Tax=Lentilactobacillus senioris TaxID=931534 RepID=UPI00227F6D00|nr:NAD(P)-dependent oxidoreductase [Lentilactobacillus senioris]MCY9807426.1 NAD(P)-dependent oxidoreductase [Lentilactobacillus senioris]